MDVCVTMNRVLSKYRNVREAAILYTSLQRCWAAPGTDPGVSKPGGILVSGDRFGAPSHIPYAFIVRVENKIHIVNFTC